MWKRFKLSGKIIFNTLDGDGKGNAVTERGQQRIFCTVETVLFLDLDAGYTGAFRWWIYIKMHHYGFFYMHMTFQVKVFLNAKIRLKKIPCDFKASNFLNLYKYYCLIEVFISSATFLLTSTIAKNTYSLSLAQQPISPNPTIPPIRRPSSILSANSYFSPTPTLYLRHLSYKCFLV